MIEKFQGRDGKPQLMDALRRQFLVDGSNDISERIASDMMLREYPAGEAIFKQGERGSDLCLILHGTVSILVDSSEVAVVKAGMHVGEIGMLEPFLPAAVDESELRAAVQAAIAGGATTIGAVMGRVLPQFKGRAEGSVINAIAREELTRAG